ncbi:MAG: hypothetical protein R6V05_09625, partial [Candidatus Brocadiia bacterium]
IGTHPAEICIEMARRHPMVAVPRAWGARARGPQSGARLRLIVNAHTLPVDQHPSDYLTELARQIGPLPMDLTANGNTYPAVVLEALRAGHRDGPAREFEARFLMAVQDDRPTTTPAPYPTTTTTAAPTAPNCGALDAGALQSGGQNANEASLDAGALNS